MNFGFCVRESSKHGGDLIAINSVKDGLQELGHRVFTGPDALSVIKSDYIFITNTCLPQNHNIPVLKKYSKRWGVITFHEDFFKYMPTMEGFVNYTINSFKHGTWSTEQDFQRYAIEYLDEGGDIVQLYARSGTPESSHTNRFILEGADTVFAHSEIEKHNILRHIPNANVKVCRWGSGMGEKDYPYMDSFLKLTGLTKGEYTLSVGRIEGRKNQLASLLALRDSDIPMVFTTPTVYSKQYIQLVVEVAEKRKGPTIIVSQEFKSKKIGNVRIIGTKGHLLPNEEIVSAYQNAGLHLHPPFYEMPGYTYLEAAKYNLPQVASSWGSIQEYFKQGGSETLDGRVKFVIPHHLGEIRRAVEEQFGKTFEPMPEHPIFSRTNVEVAKDFLKHIIL